MRVSNKDGPDGAGTPRGPDHKEMLVIESSVAHPNTTHTGGTHTGGTHTADANAARHSRGVAIATNRLEEIKKLSPGCYCVPASDPSTAYVVDPEK
jgi:hypothetical protein